MAHSRSPTLTVASLPAIFPPIHMNEQAKQRVVRGLRAAGLIGVVDGLLYWQERLRRVGENRAFVREHPAYAVPPYPILFDALGNCSLRGYLQSGLADGRFIAATIRRYLKGDLVVCEWGCGPARILRQLGALDGGLRQLIGADYNTETIEWCRRAIPGVRFAVNGLRPPLDIPAGSVDVLYAISVFTHLSAETQREWAVEVRRVLRPGGLFLFTVHGERCVSKLLPDERARFDQGVPVVREKVREGKKHFVSYESADFVRRVLLEGFTEVEPIEWPSVHQDTWVARVPL